jgi:hypothetical protein
MPKPYQAKLGGGLDEGEVLDRSGLDLVWDTVQVRRPHGGRSVARLLGSMHSYRLYGLADSTMRSAKMPPIAPERAAEGEVPIFGSRKTSTEQGVFSPVTATDRH